MNIEKYLTEFADKDGFKMFRNPMDKNTAKRIIKQLKKRGVRNVKTQDAAGDKVNVLVHKTEMGAAFTEKDKVLDKLGIKHKDGKLPENVQLGISSRGLMSESSMGNIKVFDVGHTDMNDSIYYKVRKKDFTWKSDKQAKFFYNAATKNAAREGKSTFKFKTKSMFGKDYSANVPEGTRFIIYTEKAITGAYGVDFGKKYRRKAYFVYCNLNGILGYDEVKFKYDDKRSWSGPDKLITGERTNISPDDNTQGKEIEKREKERIANSPWTKIKKSKYVGKPGDKLQKTLKVLNISSFDSSFGYNQVVDIILMVDEDFNAYVYKGRALYVDKGDVIDVKFTIKKHDEYKGTKQNVIIRPKILEKK